MVRIHQLQLLLPVAPIKVITDTVKEIDDNQSYNFQLCLLLGIAYSASLGGIATPIGTSPNGVLIQFAGDNFNKDIGFANWIAFGLPVTIILGPLVWYLLTRFIYPVNFKASINAKAELETMLSELGAMTNEEKKVVIVFTFTAFCWIFRQVLDDLPGLSLLDDSVIAMIGGLSLFFINQKDKKEKLLNWEDAQNDFPWGLIFLFGGGMALAYVVNDSGLALWLASLIPSQTYFFIVLFIVITMVILLTELTSNLQLQLPFTCCSKCGSQLGNRSDVINITSYFVSSCAFMLPVATPPNSIVYASGLIPIQKW